MSFLVPQTEASADYATLVSKHILNTQNIVEAIIRGPSSDKLFTIMR